VPERETNSIISHCHDLACGGHASIDKIAAKVLKVGSYWPTLSKDVHKHVRIVIDVNGQGVYLGEIKCPELHT